MWRVEINLHPQQATVELLVELHGTICLPDAAIAQQVTDQLDVPRDEVLHTADIERPEGLLHDQEHQGQIRTDLRGPGKLQERGELRVLPTSPLTNQFVMRYWNFRDNMKWD